MKEVTSFVMKGILKSKYILLVPIILIFFMVTLLTVNSQQSGPTSQELQDTFDHRKETVNFLIGNLLNKKSHLGLPEEQQIALDSLLVQEGYLKEISTKLGIGDLDISTENLAYLKEYNLYENYDFINYNNTKLLEVEHLKAATLQRHDLTYTEQETPYNTTLFSKQLFQIVFSPFTAFLFLLIFIYKLISDDQNRIFEFFKVNSLSNITVYFGYLMPFVILLLKYTILASFLSLLPPIVTGNLDMIHYPIEVVIGTDTLLVPVWKWLLYLPIGWGIFVSLMLVFAICLFKYRISFSFLIAIITFPIVIAYICSVHFGFLVVNPIHLIVSYDKQLLATNRFITYLFGMLILLILCLAACYPVFKSKRTVLRSSFLSHARKKYVPKPKWKLLQFEQIKKKRKGHVLFTFILLVGIIGGTFVVVNQAFQKLPTIYLNVIDDFQNILIDQQVQWKVIEEEFDLEAEKMKSSSEESKDISTEFPEENPYSIMIKDIENEYNNLEGLKDEIGTQDFSKMYREIMESSQSYKELDPSMWNVTVMASEEQQRILDGKNITPWPIGHQWISHFNDPSYAVDSVHYKLMKSSQERNTKYGNSGLFSLYKFLDWNMMLIVLGIYILLSWTSLSEEQRPNPSIHFLTTKPITFKSIYTSKWAYNLVIAYSMLLISGGIVFIISLLIGGLGESDYPILVYATGITDDEMFFSNVDNVHFFFESLMVLIVKSGVLIVAQIFFLNSLFSLIGKWVKNHYVTIIITVLISVAGYFLANQYITVSFMHLNPFIYFDTWHIVDGWKSVLSNSPTVNFNNGLMILLSSGLLLFLIGFIPKRKRVS